MKKLLFLIIILIAATAFLYFKSVQIINTPQQLDQVKIIQIRNGMGLREISKMLEEEQLVQKDWHFLLYARINKIFPKVKAGEYLIDKPMSLIELAQLLSSGKIYQRKLTVAEGLTSQQIKNILLQNDLLSNDVQDIQEGSFLPETYTFSRGEKRQNIVNQAQKAMQMVLQQAWNERDADLPLKNKEEMLILASIVEKETGLAEERPKVASVFVNRLHKGMMLQTDPTVIYAITKGKKDLQRSLNRNDLAVDSFYNTYKYAGLPPTPICNPGKASIMAVAHPDKTPYLYFVAAGNGGHNFARSLSEHNENVRKWRLLNRK